MELGSEKPARPDPHVELELALKEVHDVFTKKIDAPSVIGTGTSKVLDAGLNGSVDAAPSDLQQACAVGAPSSRPDEIPWLQFSTYNPSDKGAGEGDDVLTTAKLPSDEVCHGGTGISRQPRSAVLTSYSVLPSERLSRFSKYNHKVVQSCSLKVSCHENDAPACKLAQDASHRESVMAIATGSGKKLSEPSLVERTEPPSVHKERSNGKGRAELKFSGATGGIQRVGLVESQGPNSGSTASLTTFSGLFKSILAPENPSSQLVVRANGQLATSSGVNDQVVKAIANNTTRLMLDSLSQPHRRLEPPGNALELRNRMKPNAAVPARGGRPDSYREARVASAATTASAAAAAAKNAVQAAEASIEALAQLGVNNGNLYQGRNSFINPQPLRVANGSEPAAAGVKRPFQDQRPPSVNRNGGTSTTGRLDFIKIGSFVEVMPEEDGLQGGWFIAKVISITPKEALVAYDDLMTDEGCSRLEESFPLHCSREEDTFGTIVPGVQGWIRPVHPFSSSQKRGYLSIVQENWVVGDHVDAFVDDGWWEGIIEDLDEADETRITVFFPGDSSTTVVRSWNVRPSLIWKMGEWRPCKGDSVEQDGPPSKRQRTSSGKGIVEREQAKAKATPARNSVQGRKMTPEPLPVAPMRQSERASRSDSKGMIVYSKKRGTGQALVTPGRELRSGTRSNATTAQTKVPASSNKTSASKKPTVNVPSENTRKGSSRSQQTQVAMKTDPSWDVRRLSTRLQQKESTQIPPDVGNGSTPSSRSAKRVVVPPQGTMRGKTPSRTSHQREAVETPRNLARGKALAIIPQPREEPQTRARTRALLSAAKKG